MYLKGHYLGPESQQKLCFSLVESRRKRFLAIQALLPAIFFFVERGVRWGQWPTVVPGAIPAKALGYQDIS